MITGNALYRKLVDESFEIGILLKSIFGFFELLVGIILATSGRVIVSNLIIMLTQQEVSEDPKDFFTNYLIKTSNNFFADVHIFAIVYLIFHGLVNIFLSVFLLRGKRWAYPVAISLFSMFLIYQIYRCFYTHSLVLMLLSVFDAVIVTLIYLEYRKNKI